ncbi:MAG TPA: class I SAM-dependent methyltransferase [Mycobacteriales bacterium]|nr:class I SAM-dependent methyltransferase [Mycobacteriales bacterium]
MPSEEPSRTALMSAVSRGKHRLADPWPWVMDDPYALSLVGPTWPDIYATMTQVFRPPVLRQAMAAMINRARYVEDRLEAGTFEQYVILGAGLDSFAWRRPDRLPTLRVFELDHPATQAWKQERAAVLALPQHDQHIFVATDFEIHSLQESLDVAGFDWTRPALFSWLGVTQYLTRDAITATLQTVARAAAGSEITVTYIPPREFLDELGAEFIDTVARVAGDRGEPVHSLLAPDEALALVEDSGLIVRDHPARNDMHRRYFAGRTDGLSIPTTQRLITAGVR